ncbi:MAG: glycoside hydrolase family 31 protein, partial [Bacteroidales bacterium]|nr:glycoside hydrolase family 31 protein [Bacteroidales bacterium]
IYHSELPPVKIKAKQKNEYLNLDSREWRLTANISTLSFELSSKLSGKTLNVRLDERNLSGWRNRDDIKFHDISDQKCVQIDNGWMIEFKINNHPASIKIHVLREDIIRLGVYGDQLGNWSNLSILFKTEGPFYGGGERFTGCVLNGKLIDNHPLDMKKGFPLPPFDNLEPWQYETSYIPAPFVFTPKGLGIYTDDAFSKQLDFRDADNGTFSITNYGASTDLYLFTGNHPKAVIEAYTFLTGRPEVLDPWGYGVWVNLLEGKDKVLKDAKFLKDKNVPVTGIWIFDQEDPLSNTGWTLWTNGYYGRSVRSMNDSLESMGYRSLTYLRPSIPKELSYYRMDNPNYQEGIRRKVFLNKTELQGARPIIDFLTENGLDMWSGFLKEIYVSEHYDGYMEDFGDILHNEIRFYPPETDYYDELPNITKAEYNNIYPLLYHKFSNLIAKTYNPGYISFSRSGSAGSQAFSRMIWAGDQWATWCKLSGYPTTISAGITAGFAGYSNWSTDVLSHSPSKELWMRWVEFGALTPLLRDHLWSKQPTSVRLLTDDETVDHFRKYARLHTNLFPYLYTLAHEAHETGVPIIRHTILECPDEKEGYLNEYSYFLGDNIFVAPVISEGATICSFYLPVGKWVNYWTGVALEGGKNVTV